MEDLLIMLIFGLLYECGWLNLEALNALWRLFLWLSEPIRQEIAFRRLVKEERAKEQQLLAAHQEAVQQIDQAVAQYDHLHEQALAQSDHTSSPRQSG
jgi:hypothetical protein